MQSLRPVLVVAAVATVLLVYLWANYGNYANYSNYANYVSYANFTEPRQPPTPRYDVFWSDDAMAATAPFVYRFSSYYPNFPGVRVSEVNVSCLPRGAATVRTGGRLGNYILEFASLWTAARLYNLTAFVPADLRDRLAKVFEPLGLPETTEFLSQSGCPADALSEADQRLTRVELETTPLHQLVAQANERHVHIVFEMWIVLPETIIPMVAEVRRHFRYLPSLREYAEGKLRSLRYTVLETNPEVKEVVFAGVHVRRTDYARHVKIHYNSDRPADERYYGRAALWLNSTVVPPGGELALVVASDDPSWVGEVLLPHFRSLGLRHSFLAGDGVQEAPERDLALLSACNHSVFAYGTFGLWSALMAGGHAVVYHLHQGDAMTIAMQFAQHMPGWVAMSIDDTEMAATTESATGGGS